MKKLIAKSERCRACEKHYIRTKGITHHDDKCCSETCYISVARITYNPFKSRERKPIVVIDGEVWKKRRNTKRKQWKKKYKEGFYTQDTWLSLRYQAIKKYGYKCMLCHSTGGQMHVDHIKPRSKHPELALDFNNLQILCRDCNIGKSNKDDTDFRNPRDLEPVPDHLISNVNLQDIPVFDAKGTFIGMIDYKSLKR